MEAVNKKTDWETRHTESLRQISETLEVACNTSEMISLQSEQLNQTERDLDHAQSAIDTSKRIIRGMAWSGWLYNRFVDSGTRVVKTPETKVAVLSPDTHQKSSRVLQIAMGFICPECRIEFASDLLLMTHYRSKHDSISVVSSESTSQSEDSRRGTTSQQVEGERSSLETRLDDVHTAYLSALEPSLKELKQASLAMGYALDTQNKQLDRIDDKVDRANDEMRIVALQSKRLLGSKSDRPIHTFRCALQEDSSQSFMQDVRGEPRLSANVISEGCTYRAFSVDTENNVWGFQSELSGAFLGVNRFGYLKIKATELKAYEQFIMNLDQPTTTLFCTASYMWTGGWVSRKQDKDGNGEFDERLGIVRGTPDNKCLAARFKVVLIDKLVQAPSHTQH